MDNNRMRTADMLQYCDEALAWEEFGPVDIFFFESVKKILLGECSAIEEPEDDIAEDSFDIDRPITAEELAQAELSEKAFKEGIFSEGFFVDDESVQDENDTPESFTVNV